MLVDVLVVCAANREEGSAAAGLISAEAKRRSGERPEPVATAGPDSGEWKSMFTAVADAMTARGVDMMAHPVRPLDVADVLSSGLVITMTEEQRHQVIRLAPSVVSRCFTLRELARLVSSPRWDEDWNGAWNGEVNLVQRLHALRPLVPPAREREDIVEPTGGNRRRVRSVLRDIDSAVERVSPALFAEPVPDKGDRRSSKS